MIETFIFAGAKDLTNTSQGPIHERSQISVAHATALRLFMNRPQVLFMTFVDH